MRTLETAADVQKRIAASIDEADMREGMLRAEKQPFNARPVLGADILTNDTLMETHVAMLRTLCVRAGIRIDFSIPESRPNVVGKGAGSAASASRCSSAATPFLPMRDRTKERAEYDRLVAQHAVLKSAANKIGASLPANWKMVWPFAPDAREALAQMAWRVDLIKSACDERDVDTDALLRAEQDAPTEYVDDTGRRFTGMTARNLHAKAAKAKAERLANPPPPRPTDAQIAKMNVTEICAAVRAGSITAEEGNDLIRRKK